MNEDESMKCIQISIQKLAAGNKDAAIKFAKKALALHDSSKSRINVSHTISLLNDVNSASQDGKCCCDKRKGKGKSNNSRETKAIHKRSGKRNQNYFVGEKEG